MILTQFFYYGAVIENFLVCCILLQLVIPCNSPHVIPGIPALTLCFSLRKCVFRMSVKEGMLSSAKSRIHFNLKNRL